VGVGPDDRGIVLEVIGVDFPEWLASGPDVDLAAADVRDSEGRRITQQYVEAAVEDAHARTGAGGGRR
jgi:hypothetical protein